MNDSPSRPFDVEAAVLERYARGARQREEELCCPTPADPSEFDFLPREVVEKDYGCGDPTRFVREGDTVLDLGSGAGRVCFLASRRVGPRGRVVGVDFNDEMLAVARRNAPIVAERLGYGNVEFRKGRIQDLSLDLERLDELLRARPVGDLGGWIELERTIAALRREHPLVPSESVDLVVSNCVLNLVPDEQKPGLFREIHRVLRRGGRVAISDIVCDEDVPPEWKEDPDLWSGCLSGAMREDRFVRAFEEAGFYGVRIESWAEKPWRVIEGVEFRSVTVTARKGKEGPCLERRQAVVYLGPWKEVLDDDGHRLLRGRRVAVCDKTFRILTSEPYGGEVVGIEPPDAPPLEEAEPFRCSGGVRIRPPSETKGGEAVGPAANKGNCGPDCC